MNVFKLFVDWEKIRKEVENSIRYVNEDFDFVRELIEIKSREDVLSNFEKVKVYKFIMEAVIFEVIIV